MAQGERVGCGVSDLKQGEEDHHTRGGMTDRESEPLRMRGHPHTEGLHVWVRVLSMMTKASSCEGSLTRDSRA